MRRREILQLRQALATAEAAVNVLAETNASLRVELLDLRARIESLPGGGRCADRGECVRVGQVMHALAVAHDLTAGPGDITVSEERQP